MIGTGDDKQPFFGCGSFVILVRHFDWYKLIIRSVYEQNRHGVFPQGVHTRVFI